MLDNPSAASAALAKDQPDGLPSDPLARICGGLPEASIPEEFKDASTSLAADWTDLETFSRLPSAKRGPCADPEASWGHRNKQGTPCPARPAPAPEPGTRPECQTEP